MRTKLLGALAIALLAACTTQGTAPAWTPAQTAYVELAITTAAVQIAEATEPTLPPADAADVKAAISAFSGAVQTQVSVLVAGGSLSAQAQSTAVGAISSAVASLGQILASKPVAIKNPQAVAMAAGAGALQAVPTVAGAIISVNGGLLPDAPTLAASTAAFQAAVASATAP